jgi:hypothetical protein
VLNGVEGRVRGRRRGALTWTLDTWILSRRPEEDKRYANI